MPEGPANPHDTTTAGARATIGGIQWQFAPQHTSLAQAPWLQDVGRPESLRDSSCLKHSQVRDVYRFSAEGYSGLVLKVFRTVTVWQRFKERVFRSAAQTEWDALLRLPQLGVSVCRAVALGRPVRWKTDAAAYLIIEEERQVLAVKPYLKSFGADAPSAGIAGKCSFARELGAFVRRCHDAGVRHDDLHPGNILVRTAPKPDEDRFVLIDLQRLRAGSPPGWRHRANAVALLLRTFRGDNPSRRRVRRAFLDAYLTSGPPLPSEAFTLDAIDQRTARLNRRRLRSRLKRCVTNSSEFAVESRRDTRIYHARTYAAEQLLEAARGLDPLSSPNSEAVTQTLPDAGTGARALTVTAYPPPPFAERVLRFLRRSPALREYVRLHRTYLERRGGPRPVAAIEYRAGHRKGQTVLIVEGGEADNGSEA